jgi:hypothetical protein
MNNLKKLYNEVILKYSMVKSFIQAKISELTEDIKDTDDIDEKFKIQCEINELLNKYDLIEWYNNNKNRQIYYRNNKQIDDN